jgi:DNA polymerase elongation subunit (family B)
MHDPMVFDIETVPGNKQQLETYKAIKCARCDHNPELHPKQKKDYCKECDDDAALRWHTSNTVCVTAKIVDGEMFCFCDRDEYAVLSQAYDLFEELKPRPYIGFNIKEFDVVHLKMRGLVLGIPFLDILPVGKYDKNMVDLYDQLTEGKWNKQQSATLEMMSAMMGFHNLLYGHGSQVPIWFLNGELDEIKKHNMGDVLATEQLYKRSTGVGKIYRSRKKVVDDEEIITL